MHLRRAVLLMAAILMAVAIVTAIVPAPRGRRRAEPAPAPAASAGRAPVKTIALRYPPAAAPPRVEVSEDAHVVLQVATSDAGEATVDALGLVAPAEPNTPANFDVLASRPGTYTVAFEPADGSEAHPVGTVRVRGRE